MVPASVLFGLISSVALGARVQPKSWGYGAGKPVTFQAQKKRMNQDHGDAICDAALGCTCDYCCNPTFNRKAEICLDCVQNHCPAAPASAPTLAPTAAPLVPTPTSTPAPTPVTTPAPTPAPIAVDPDVSCDPDKGCTCDACCRPSIAAAAASCITCVHALCPTTPPTATPSPAPTAASSDVSSFGDPHSKNIHGQRFDIQRPGNHSLVVLPRGADQQRANLYVEARVTRRGGLCTGKLFITGLKLAGRWVRMLGGDVELYAATDMFNSPEVVGLKLGSSSNLSLQEFVARIPKHNLVVSQSRPELPAKLNTHVNTLMLQFNIGPITVKVGWAHEKLEDGFANWLWLGVSGFGTTDEVGGLLGSDDHSAVQTTPEDVMAACEANPHLLGVWAVVEG